MKNRIGILMTIILVTLNIVVITASYKIDITKLENSLKKYQMNHQINGDMYVTFVEKSLLYNEKDIETENKSNIIEDKKVKKQGIYYTPLITYYKYIKFNEDNTVITFTTNCTPEEVMQWNKEQLEGSPIGTYYIDENNIIFSTKQEKPEGYTVTVNYKGINNGENLVLNSFSEATKHRSNLLYKYYQ